MNDLYVLNDKKKFKMIKDGKCYYSEKQEHLLLFGNKLELYIRNNRKIEFLSKIEIEENDLNGNIVYYADGQYLWMIKTNYLTIESIKIYNTMKRYFLFCHDTNNIIPLSIQSIEFTRLKDYLSVHINTRLKDQKFTLYERQFKKTYKINLIEISTIELNILDFELLNNVNYHHLNYNWKFHKSKNDKIYIDIYKGKKGGELEDIIEDDTLQYTEQKQYKYYLLDENNKKSEMKVYNSYISNKNIEWSNSQELYFNDRLISRVDITKEDRISFHNYYKNNKYIWNFDINRKVNINFQEKDYKYYVIDQLENYDNSFSYYCNNGINYSINDSDNYIKVSFIYDLDNLDESKFNLYRINYVSYKRSHKIVNDIIDSIKVSPDDMIVIKNYKQKSYETNDYTWILKRDKHIEDNIIIKIIRKPLVINNKDLIDIEFKFK